MSETDVEFTGLECGRCGRALEATKIDQRHGPTWWDGDLIACAPCGTTNQISVDDDPSDESDPEYGTAYVTTWTCKHGVEEGCVACDEEDDAAPKETGE